MKNTLKKMMVAILSSAACLSLPVTGWAGLVEYYNDYPNPNGTYSYYFDLGEYMAPVFVTMDKDWYRQTRVLLEERGAAFYHRRSYDAYAEEGMKGGWLFTIGASVNTSFRDLPHFEYLGFDDESAMNYYAELPTDYQAYMGDESIRAEYDALWEGVEDVIAGISIRTYPDNSNPQETEPMAPGTENHTSGDYAYQVNEDGTATITKYNADRDMDVVDIPSELDGHPVSGIGYQAFTYKKMNHVTIPDTVRKIGPRAFEYCIIHEELRLPGNVLFCEDSFSSAKLPSVLTFPEGAEIEENAFSYCDTVEQVFAGPGSVIHGRAFGYCDMLKKVVCGEGSLLEARAFEYCEALNDVVYCGTVKTEEDAFSYCGDITFSQAGDISFPSQAGILTG